jgi:hypothetical protein
MFVVEGIGGTLGSLAYACFQPSPLLETSNELYFDPYALGWIASSLAVLFAGVYLVVGGRWVLEAIFLPPSHTDDQEVDDPVGP